MTQPSIPWNTRRQQPRRPDWPRLVLLGGIILAIVVFAYFLVTRLFGGGCDEPYCPASADVPPPDGFVLASDILEYKGEPLNLDDGAGVEITVPLKGDAGSNSLSFFQLHMESGTWEPLGPAVPEDSGNRAVGRFTDTPPVIAVMQRLSSAAHVVAYLPAGATLHPEAQDLVTILHTADFRPAADGTLEGAVSPVSLPEGADHYPSIVASEAEAGSLANLEDLLANGTQRSNHAREIAALVAREGLEGIDISYLDLRADQAAGFLLFVQELADLLHANGHLLTVTLPPPTVANGQVDEGAYNWAALGAAADLLQMRPVRDQDVYRTDVPLILEYITARVPAGRVALMVTPYATEKSGEGLRPLSLADAMVTATQLSVVGSQLAPNENVEIVGTNIDQTEEMTGLVWDVNTATIAYTYRREGNRTVFLENSYSVGFKLEFINRYDLGGVAIEDASDNSFLGNIWPAIRPFVETGQPVLMQPNPQDLRPRWRASDGLLEGGQQGVVRWTAPAQPGTFSVHLILSEGTALFDAEIRLAVQERETPPAGG